MTAPIIPVSPDSDNLKRCSKCGELKSIDAFSRACTAPDGLQRRCKACARAYYAANRERIAERGRTYRAANAERITERKREYDATHVKQKAERNREYRAANRERIAEQKLEYNREYRAVNREQRAKYNREYYAANREQRAEYQRTYLQTDAGKAVHRAGDHNRRAREQAAGSGITTADLAAIQRAQTDKRGRLICWRCGKPIKGTPHLDHWIPLSKGGTNDAGNLHYMHAHCNLTKNAKHPTEIGRLI